MSDASDAKGAYSLEIHYYPIVGWPDLPADPVPMTLHAFLNFPGNPTPFESDYIPVSLKFSPVGEVPEVANVDISIDVTP